MNQSISLAISMALSRAMPLAILCCSLVIAGCGGGGSTAESPATGAVMGNSGPQTSTFAGVIADKNGLGIGGVAIAVYLDNDHSEHVTTTDSTGYYSVANLQAGWPYGQYEIWADKAGYAFLPSPASGAGTVTKSDHNALFKTVIALGVQTALNVTNANFTALRSGDRLINLPRSGQITSYVVGDDAALAQGVAWPATRFVDNNDGTVSDSLTGLVWLQDAGCIAAQNWTNALTSAAQLASGTCGLTDGSSAGQWRMPNVGELESLVDVSRNNPAVAAAHPFSHIANTYWSSTTYRGDTSAAWVIRFTDGRYINDSLSNLKATALHALWAVKSGGTGAVALPATGQFIVYASGDDASLLKGIRMPYPRFIDNNNGTVTDSVTGLIWLKRADCIHATWAGAVAAINTLASGQCDLIDGSTAGQWRMPNRTEMLSLVDRAETNQALRFNSMYLKANGSVDQAAVFNTFRESEFYWTSTTNSSDLTEAWTVYSCDFGVYNIAKPSIGYALAVR